MLPTLCGMAKTYRPYCPDQMFLLPPSLRDWLPENHLSYFVSDVVDSLDLDAIESFYEKEDRGQPPYHPRMMTKEGNARASGPLFTVITCNPFFIALTICDMPGSASL